MTHPALVQAQLIMDQKSEDYAATDHARSNYFPYGYYSYLHMLQMKVKRLDAVLLNDSKPNFESAADSALDLINYAAFLHAYIEAQE
tara:strand:+ start:424 stop:684 length:261 start_codon:yes stop_codon:yes gene_type:complete